MFLDVKAVDFLFLFELVSSRYLTSESVLDCDVD